MMHTKQQNSYKNNKDSTVVMPIDYIPIVIKYVCMCAV